MNDWAYVKQQAMCMQVSIHREWQVKAMKPAFLVCSRVSEEACLTGGEWVAEKMTRRRAEK